MAYHVIAKALEQRKDEFGVTIAVAIVLRLHGPIPPKIDAERWVQEIDSTILLAVDVCRDRWVRSGRACYRSRR